MQKLYDDGMHAELLMLPERFWPGLRDFLAQHPQLLWLLQLKSGDMAGAAGALVQTAGACKVREIEAPPHPSSSHFVEA